MNWQKVKLGDLMIAHYGKALKAEMRDANGEYDVFGSSGFVGKHSHAINEEPTLIIGRKGSVGSVTYAPNGGWTIDTAYYVETKTNSNIDLRYLFYCLRNANLPELAITTSIPGLNREALYRVEIPLPPLYEQKRIAAILDAADALRRTRRESLARLDELAQSLFLEMFGDPATNPKGWETERIGNWAIKFSDGPFGSNLKSSHYVEEGVRVIRLQNIGIGEMVDKDKAFISREHYESLPRNHCAAGDVLIGTLGDPNLRACILPPSIPEALNKADCVQMRVDETKAHPLYVVSLLNQHSVEKMAMGDIQGQTRLRISMGRLREMKFPLPPLSLQQSFARQIEELETIKTRARTQLLELDALFASLQERAFSGQL